MSVVRLVAMTSWISQWFFHFFEAWTYREGFPLIVSRRNCVLTRKFVGVLDRSDLQAFTVLGRLYMSVRLYFERSISVFDHLWPFLWLEKLRNCNETLRNSQKCWILRDVGRSETFLLYIMNGLKRWQNHVYASKKNESL